MTETSIGARVPRRGNAFSRWLGASLLRLFGWRIEGALPDLAKAVVIVAPHTSNWDFFYGVCAKFALGVRIGWIGKHTLFRWPFGGFMRWLGGEPVERHASIGRVAQIVDVIHRHDRYFLGLSPEGTRKKVERWRTGFYHVAREAAIPILLTWLDYRRKVVGIGPLFHPTGEIEADLADLRAFYGDKPGKHPDQF